MVSLGVGGGVFERFLSFLSLEFFVLLSFFLSPPSASLISNQNRTNEREETTLYDYLLNPKKYIPGKDWKRKQISLVLFLFLSFFLSSSPCSPSS